MPHKNYPDDTIIYFDFDMEDNYLRTDVENQIKFYMQRNLPLKSEFISTGQGKAHFWVSGKVITESVPTYAKEFKLHSPNVRGKAKPEQHSPSTSKFMSDDSSEFKKMCKKVKNKLEKKGEKVIGDCMPIPVTNPPDTLCGIEPLMPAYGRDYKHLIDVQMDFLEGKDFLTPARGAASIRELEGIVSKIRVRYNGLTETGYIYVMTMPEVMPRIKSHEKQFKLHAPVNADCPVPQCFTGYEIIYNTAPVIITDGEHKGKTGVVDSYDVEPPTAEVKIGGVSHDIPISSIKILGNEDYRVRRNGKVYFAFESENSPKYDDFDIIVLDPSDPKQKKEIDDVVNNDTWGTFVWMIAENKRTAKEDFWDAYDNYKLWEILGYTPKPSIPGFAEEFVLHSPNANQASPINKFISDEIKDFVLHSPYMPGSKLKQMMSDEGFWLDPSTNEFRHKMDDIDGPERPYMYDDPGIELIDYMRRIGFEYDDKWGTFYFKKQPEIPEYANEFVLSAMPLTSAQIEEQEEMVVQPIPEYTKKFRLHADNVDINIYELLKRANNMADDDDAEAWTFFDDYGDTVWDNGEDIVLAVGKHFIGWRNCDRRWSILRPVFVSHDDCTGPDWVYGEYMVVQSIPEYAKEFVLSADKGVITTEQMGDVLLRQMDQSEYKNTIEQGYICGNGKLMCSFTDYDKYIDRYNWGMVFDWGDLMDSNPDKDFVVIEYTPEFFIDNPDISEYVIGVRDVEDYAEQTGLTELDNSELFDKWYEFLELETFTLADESEILVIGDGSGINFTKVLKYIEPYN